MTDTPTVTFTVDKVGDVQMIGTGPWSVRANGVASFEIVDSTGAVANPTVVAKFSTSGKKPNRNVVFAKRATTEQIVETANAQLEASA